VTLDLRRIVLLVALLNLAYFGIEFAVAARIGSVSLFADSIDFLEDTCLNVLVWVGLAKAARHRAILGKLLAGLLLIPSLATVYALVTKVASFTSPEPLPLSLTGAGALAVNLGCALLLARHRHRGGSLSRAAFLSARNDALANVAIVAAGAVTWYAASAWPDLIVGLGIAAMNAGAAREVFRAARQEQDMIAPHP